MLIPTVPTVLKVTAGHEAGADLGPVISPASKERIQRLVKSAVDEGADVILDGTDLKVRRFDSKLSILKGTDCLYLYCILE